MSLRVLFDTNVVLDVLLAREPFRADAEALFRAAERGQITGLLCATALTTVDYVVGRARGPAVVRDAVRALLSVFDVAAVGHSELSRAAASGFSDFEDGVVHEAAVGAGAGVIVTRNLRDFAGATVDVASPEAVLRLLDVA